MGVRGARLRYCGQHHSNIIEAAGHRRMPRRTLPTASRNRRLGEAYGRLVAPEAECVHRFGQVRQLRRRRLSRLENKECGVEQRFGMTAAVSRELRAVEWRPVEHSPSNPPAHTKNTPAWAADN